MIVKTESRKLMCQLSEEELLQRGDELAKTYIEIAALDLQKKRITAQIKPLDERIESLVVIIDTKEEERPVKCQWEYDFNFGVKKLHRMDTYDVIDTGDIKDWERQQQLGLQVEQTAGSEDEGISVCLNDACEHNKKDTANGCSILEHVFECEKMTSLPATEPITEEPRT